jgi:hypothetical protein
MAFNDEKYYSRGSYRSSDIIIKTSTTDIKDTHTDTKIIL